MEPKNIFEKPDMVYNGRIYYPKEWKVVTAAPIPAAAHIGNPVIDNVVVTAPPAKPFIKFPPVTKFNAPATPPLAGGLIVCLMELKEV